MKRPAALTCTFLALLSLPAAAYLSQPSSRDPARQPALETSPKVATKAPQVPPAARAWADPPARQEYSPTASMAAVEAVEVIPPVPAATGTLPPAPDLAVPPAALASPKRVHGSRLRAALIKRPDGFSRRVEVSRPKRPNEQDRASTPTVVAQDEPKSTRVEAEPIEFSLASR